MEKTWNAARAFGILRRLEMVRKGRLGIGLGKAQERVRKGVIQGLLRAFAAFVFFSINRLGTP